MVWRLNGALYRWLSGTQLKWSTDTKNTNSVSRSAEEGFTVSGPFTQCPRRPEVTLSPLSGELSEAHTYALAEFIKHLAEGRLVGSRRRADLRGGSDLGLLCVLLSWFLQGSLNHHPSLF